MANLIRKMRPFFNSTSSENNFKVIYHRILRKKQSLGVAYFCLRLRFALYFIVCFLVLVFFFVFVFLHSKGRTVFPSPIPCVCDFVCVCALQGVLREADGGVFIFPSSAGSRAAGVRAQLSVISAEGTEG